VNFIGSIKNIRITAAALKLGTGQHCVNGIRRVPLKLMAEKYVNKGLLAPMTSTIKPPFTHIQ
jgi:hypothetical protein